MWKRLIYISISLLLYSCYPVRKTSIEVLMPSDFSFPETTENIIVLNNSPIFSISPDAGKSMASLSENEVFIIDTIVTTKLFDGFFSIMDQSPMTNLRESSYVEIRRITENKIPEPLSEEAVIDFCENNAADAVISFEFFDLELDYSAKNIFSFSSGAYVQANLLINRQAFWRIYDFDGFILDEYLINDTLAWTNSDYYENNAYSGLPLATEVIREAFFTAGENFGKRISPYWQVVSRVYYLFRSADKVDHSMDRDFLLKLSDHRRVKISYRACLNLALLSEKEDDLRSSLRWLEIAEFKNPSSPYAGKYRKLIEERIAVKDKIR